MLVHTRQRGQGADAYSPIQLHVRRKPPKTVTEEQQARLLEACTRLRDRFLLVCCSSPGCGWVRRWGCGTWTCGCGLVRCMWCHRRDNVNDGRVKQLASVVERVGRVGPHDWRRVGDHRGVHDEMASSAWVPLIQYE